MDVKTFSDQLRNRMDEQIELVRKEGNDELKATAKIIRVIRNCLFELKKFVHQYEFKGQEEEIHFSKEIKPAFLSKYFYYDQLLSISIKTSLMDFPDRKKYHRKMLRRIQRFKERNISFYQYWLTDSVHLDDKYFIRQMTMDSDPDLDEKFSTGYDIKLARFLAHVELKEYLNNALKNWKTKPKLRWIGSKTALIELIYALQTAGVFDPSTNELRCIVTSFEQLLSIELGNYSRTYQEIRLRKAGQTKFLDLLKDKFVQRLNDWEY